MATGTIAPLFVKTNQPIKPENAAAPDVSEWRAILVTLSLLPMYADGFVAQLPEETVAGFLPRWSALLQQADNDAERKAVDLFLLAAQRHLNRADAQRTTAERIRSYKLPSGGILERDVQELVAELRGDAR